MTLPRIRQVILQPTSACNLNCSYCYVPNRRQQTTMAEEVLGRTIRLVLESDLVQGNVEFLWHAGEPLMAGRAHYRAAARLLEQYNSRDIHIRKTIQTNATLIDADWCDVFVDADFSIGVSIDGPADLHDQTRRNWAGRGSHQQVMAGVTTLRSFGIQPGAICVLTRASLQRPREIFDFFVEHDFASVSFNVEEVENAHTSSSLDAADVVAEYRGFMSTLYDLWRENGYQPRIREFQSLARLIDRKLHHPEFRRQPYETVPFAIITIQKEGNVSTFSPEFAGAVAPAYDNFVIGNITDIATIEELVRSPALAVIAAEVSSGVARCADSCLYFDLCGGGYVSNKYFEHHNLQATETTACRVHRQVLADVFIEKVSVRQPLSLRQTRSE